MDCNLYVKRWLTFALSFWQQIMLVSSSNGAFCNDHDLSKLIYSRKRCLSNSHSNPGGEQREEQLETQLSFLSPDFSVHCTVVEMRPVITPPSLTACQRPTDPAPTAHQLLEFSKRLYHTDHSCFIIAWNILHEVWQTM